MLFPADHILDSALRELAQLQTTTNSAAEGSALQALAMTLGLLAQREHAGVAAVHAQLTQLGDRLDTVESRLPSASPHAKRLATLRTGISAALAEPVVATTERRWLAILAELEELAAAIAGSFALDAKTRKAIADEFVAWECADLRGQLGAGSGGDGQAPSTEITLERWRDYLRERFDEPGLEVDSFNSLAGGFGKQTYLFSARGKALSGDYVVRRDLAVTICDNDCHRIENEYQLIRAAFEKGFPAPEALWLDTEHRQVPGGHFIVMRRSPGSPGGSVFQASGAVPQDLTITLAGILARLHTMPPLRSVGALTESIAPELWDLPAGEVTRRYLTQWRELLGREEHLPSAATSSLLGWLLDNLPESPGRPALLHGDIGFHNFLFDDGKLTAVLDWEFAHIGDPAEDLAYVRNTLGGSLDWTAFLAAYRAAGGQDVSAERIRFFQVWGHVRNACASNLVAGKFMSRQVKDLKLVLLAHVYIPQFLQAAQALIETEA